MTYQPPPAGNSPYPQSPPPGQQPGAPAGQPPHGVPQQPMPSQYGQDPYAQPGQHSYAQPGPPPGDQAAIAITSKYHWMTFTFAILKPKFTINGHQVPGYWGRAVVPIPPGQHHVQVHVPYFLPPRIGPAEVTVPVQPGQVAEVEYRAPVWQFSKGSLGPAPQQHNGWGIVIGVLVALLVILVCCCGLLFLLPSTA